MDLIIALIRPEAVHVDRQAGSEWYLTVDRLVLVRTWVALCRARVSLSMYVHVVLSRL